MSSSDLHSFLSLPESLYEKLEPVSMPNAQCLVINQELLEAKFPAIDENWQQVLGGVPSSPILKAVAQAYAGHQFGYYNPQLGDGRARLLTEIQGEDGQYYDLHLKGGGATSFARRGDGFSPLGPVLKEYIFCEALAAMGVETTRSLAAFATHKSVQREQAFPGGMFTRLAKSHLRFGSFEYLYYKGDLQTLRLLADHAIHRLYPSVKTLPHAYFGLFKIVAQKSMAMVVDWMRLGFIHGVMNTDNMLLSGETIDYGPAAFMDEFSWDACFSYIDAQKRYSYGNQGAILFWNLDRLSQALSPLLKDEGSLSKVTDFIEGLHLDFERKVKLAYLNKMGLVESHLHHFELVESFFSFLAQQKLDFTNSFIRLHDAAESFDKWPKLQDYLELHPDRSLMQKCNPQVVPRRHHMQYLIDQANQGDFSPFHEALEKLSQPFVKSEDFMQPPLEHQKVPYTFCGT